MATSIEERLLDLIVTKLATITTGNGYEQTVLQVTRASMPEPPMEVPANKIPALQLRHITTTKQPQLRGAYECLAEMEVICIAAQDATNEQLADLMADVEKVLNANKRWFDGAVNLARRTFVSGTVVHETETGESPATGSVPFVVLYRVDALDPYALKDI